MTIIDEVLGFAREYINNPAARTSDRKAKIRQALRSLTGEIVNLSCGACYIEAIIKIINRTNMATSKYELRKGVVLQVFGNPKKTCTNLTITDELGDYYMKYHPEKLIYFVRYPKAGVPTPANVEIILPTKKEEPIFVPETLINEVLNPAPEEKVKTEQVLTDKKIVKRHPKTKK